MEIRPRRESKLDDDDLFGPPPDPEPPVDPEPEPEPEIESESDQGNDQAEAPADQATKIQATKPRVGSRRRRSKGLPPPPITRNARRVIARGPVSDNDLVSFNCKMTRGLRRSVKKYAADVEVDIQDVVAAALEDYLADRGISFPGSDQQQPD